MIQSKEQYRSALYKTEELTRDIAIIDAHGKRLPEELAEREKLLSLRESLELEMRTYQDKNSVKVFFANGRVTKTVYPEGWEEPTVRKHTLPEFAQRAIEEKDSQLEAQKSELAVQKAKLERLRMQLAAERERDRR